MPKLNQILAIEKNVKNRRETELTKTYQNLGKTELVSGFTKTYFPKEENGEQFPPEQKRVQVKAADALKTITAALTELLDVAAQKDATNTKALADVVVDGKTILTSVPATHLLFLEKKVADIIQVIKTLPVLTQDQSWKLNDALGLFETEPTETVKSKKIQKFNVVVPATQQHPAQVKELTEDVTIGHWKQTLFSGALPADKVQGFLERAEKLQKAFKFAREEANQTPVVDLKTGEVVTGFIFG